MPIAVTSAMPSMSANAVAEARRGLRFEFVAASDPTEPNGAPMTRPRTGTTGNDNAGPARKRPTMTNTAAAPMSSARRLVEPSSHITPQARNPAPAASSSPPTTVRARSGCGVADSLDLIASTGWTRPARRAGAHAESTVTTPPTTIGTTTALTDSPAPAPGRPMPWASITARITATMPAPAATPRTEPSRPTRSASTTTERVICPFEAPRARSSANSFVRCATIIENVLAIKKVPTRRPTRPKAVRK